jgi:uncharacterized protein (TIGR03000 family)
VKKLFARALLCAAVALCAGPAAAGGGLEGRDGPAARGRESRIRVYLPTTETRLYVENVLTPGSGRDRLFRVPGLDEGKRYAYTLLAVYMEGGREVTHEAHIDFWGGEDVRVSFRR